MYWVIARNICQKTGCHNAGLSFQSKTKPAWWMKLLAGEYSIFGGICSPESVTECRLVYGLAKIGQFLLVLGNYKLVVS